jgi:hypothetical protein
LRGAISKEEYPPPRRRWSFFKKVLMALYEAQSPRWVGVVQSGENVKEASYSSRRRKPA